MTVAAAQARYDGKLSADGNSIEGIWAQGPPTPLSRSLLLQRATAETAWKDSSPHTSQFVTVAAPTTRRLRFHRSHGIVLIVAVTNAAGSVCFRHAGSWFESFAPPNCRS